jgi:hypothetical protein
MLLKWITYKNEKKNVRIMSGYVGKIDYEVEGE